MCHDRTQDIPSRSLAPRAVSIRIHDRVGCVYTRDSHTEAGVSWSSSTYIGLFYATYVYTNISIHIYIHIRITFSSSLSLSLLPHKLQSIAIYKHIFAHTQRETALPSYRPLHRDAETSRYIIVYRDASSRRIADSNSEILMLKRIYIYIFFSLILFVVFFPYYKLFQFLIKRLLAAFHYYFSFLSAHRQRCNILSYTYKYVYTEHHLSNCKYFFFSFPFRFFSFSLNHRLFMHFLSDFPASSKKIVSYSSIYEYLKNRKTDLKNT